MLNNYQVRVEKLKPIQKVTLMGWPILHDNQ